MEYFHLKQGSEEHHKIINLIAMRMNRNGVCIGSAVKMAMSIPTGIIECSDDGEMITSSQLDITIKSMMYSYHIAVEDCKQGLVDND